LFSGPSVARFSFDPPLLLDTTVVEADPRPTTLHPAEDRTTAYYSSSNREG